MGTRCIRQGRVVCVGNTHFPTSRERVFVEGSGAVFRSLLVIVHGLYIELIVLRHIYLTDSVYYHLVDLIRLPKAPC